MLYKNLKSTIELDKGAFVYGNIKPDMTSKLLRYPHTLENYFLSVCNNVDSLLDDQVSLKEFSFKIGEICHYVSDFFCEYHLGEQKFHRFKEHFLYELKLHFEFLLNNSYKVNSNAYGFKRNIPAIIMELRKDYLSKEPSMQKDIEYALLSTTLICESISYSSSHSEVAYLTMPLAGGQY